MMIMKAKRQTAPVEKCQVRAEMIWIMSNAKVPLWYYQASDGLGDEDKDGKI